MPLPQFETSSLCLPPSLPSSLPPPRWMAQLRATHDDIMRASPLTDDGRTSELIGVLLAKIIAPRVIWLNGRRQNASVVRQRCTIYCPLERTEMPGFRLGNYQMPCRDTRDRRERCPLCFASASTEIAKNISFRSEELVKNLMLISPFGCAVSTVMSRRHFSLRNASWNTTTSPDPPAPPKKTESGEAEPKENGGKWIGVYRLLWARATGPLARPLSSLLLFYLSVSPLPLLFYRSAPVASIASHNGIRPGRRWERRRHISGRRRWGMAAACRQQQQTTYRVPKWASASASLLLPASRPLCLPREFDSSRRK